MLVLNSDFTSAKYFAVKNVKENHESWIYILIINAMSLAGGSKFAGGEKAYNIALSINSY